METKGLKARWPHKLFSDSSRSLQQQTYTQQNKIFKQQICALTPKSAYTEVETKQQVCFSFEENFSLDLFWYSTKNNNNVADWSSASLGLDSQGCKVTKNVYSGCEGSDLQDCRSHSLHRTFRNGDRRRRREGFQKF